MSVTLGVGGTQQLSYQLLGPLYGIGTPTWSSSNPSIATVNAVGAVTAVAIGTTTITATLGSVTGTTVVTVSASSGADGSFADVQNTVGNTHITSAWEFSSSIVVLNGGGFVTSVPDVRGGTSRLPLNAFALAGNNPSYDAVNGRITTSGANYLQTPYDAGYALSSTRTLVLISTANPGTANFTACIQGPGDSDPVLGLARDARGTGLLGPAGNGAIVSKGLAPLPGIIGLHIITQIPALGVGGTLSYPLLSYERPGGLRVVQNLTGGLVASVNSAVTIGGWRNSVGLTGSIETICAVYQLNFDLPLPMIQAFERRALALGATLT